MRKNGSLFCLFLKFNFEQEIETKTIWLNIYTVVLDRVSNKNLESGIRFLTSCTADEIFSLILVAPYIAQRLLKVRQSRNDFFKPTFPPKNERTNSTLLL